MQQEVAKMSCAGIRLDKRHQQGVVSYTGTCFHNAQAKNKVDFLGKLAREKSETMKSFTDQLEVLLALVKSGSLEEVKQHCGTIKFYRRAVLESAAVISFKQGINNETVAWLASEVGTLKMTTTNSITKMTKIK